MLKEETVLVIIYFIAVIFALVTFIVIFFILFQRRKNKMLMEQIAAEQAYEQELTKTQLEIQENVLKNIAWELHDNVGQLLSVANLQLNLLINRIPEDFKGDVEETKGIITQTVQEIRSLSKVMNNDVILKNGLVTTLRTEIDRINRLNYLRAEMNVIGEERQIDTSIEIVIFRIFQECLNNILKHSKASELLLRLSFENKFLDVILSDNGRGFDSESKFEGSGMETMRTRASMIKAQLKLESEIDKGTQVSLRYYYKNGEERENI